MSSQPPSGPPTGPPTGPPRGPVSHPPGPDPEPQPERGSTPGTPSDTAGRRSPRTLALVVGGGVVVLGLAVLLVFLLRGDDKGSDRATDDASASAPGDTASAKAEALVLAKRVALTPADWGPGYEKAATYETTPVDESDVLSTCEWTRKGSRTGTLASLSRTTVHNQSQITGYSEVRMYADEPTARMYLDEVADAIHRCPSQHSGKSRWTGVREASAPAVTGFDSIVSEEGRQVVDENGKKTNSLYVLLTGRAGEHVLSASTIGDPQKEAQLRKQAAAALQKLQQRMAAEGR